ncbi:MAG TPA: sortase [Candidatus Paceibacterota bacterium]
MFATSNSKIRVFSFVTLVFFGAIFSVAHSIGFVPFYVDGTESTHSLALANLPMLGNQGMPLLPDSITIPSINLELPISNPESRDATALDEALKSGPVRYVDSARLNESGTMLVFAHSSHLPIVHNQMYKAFNELPRVNVGDSVLVSNGGTVFTYKITIVRKTDAEEELIDLSSTKKTRLILSTCDTFGKKSSRWIVEAELANG